MIENGYRKLKQARHQMIQRIVQNWDFKTELVMVLIQAVGYYQVLIYFPAPPFVRLMSWVLFSQATHLLFKQSVKRIQLMEQIPYQTQLCLKNQSEQLSEELEQLNPTWRKHLSLLQPMLWTGILVDFQLSLYLAQQTGTLSWILLLMWFKLEFNYLLGRTYQTQYLKFVDLITDDALSRYESKMN